MPEWIRLAPVTALPPGQAVRVNVDDLCLALFHVGDRFYAVDDACLHMVGPLSEGRVCDGVVTCPWHAWRYELASGTRVDRPGAPTRIYPVEIHEGWLMLGL